MVLLHYSHQRPLDHFVLTVLVLLTQAGRDALALGADPLRGQRWPVRLVLPWKRSLFFAVLLMLEECFAGACTKLLVCCAVDRCLDLISNL